MAKLPNAVLTDKLGEEIGDSVVNTAVFTTFNFDPGFFELNVLPILFPDRQFSEADKVRLMQLEDSVRSLRNLCVYYDVNALAHDGVPPKIGYDRIGLRWTTGCFHPKVVLLLVNDPDHDGSQSLIVACQSANITRSGWWENIECVHIEKVLHKHVALSPCTFRLDLMKMLERIREAQPTDNHDALEEVHEFLNKHCRGIRTSRRLNPDRWNTRLFGGSKSQPNFAKWLVDQCQIPREWNLEIVSPYFDKNDAKVLQKLIVDTKPKKTRVYLPQDDEGVALVSEEVFNAVVEMRDVTWARFPDGLTGRKASQTSSQYASRFVHAKMYRFWKRGETNLIAVGSVNCTTPAHRQRNFEAGFLIDASDQNLGRQWWLESYEEEQTRFSEQIPDEMDDTDNALFSVDLRYDWAQHEVAVRMAGRIALPVMFLDLADQQLFSVHSYSGEDWQLCDSAAADSLRESMQASSFVCVEACGQRWRAMVREQSFSHRPSLLMELTPSEILEYWSMLTDEQKARLLERKIGEKVENLPMTAPGPLVDVGNSIFNRFSGLFHAFGHLSRHLIDSLGNERYIDAEYLLFGNKYDSLPELLRKLVKDENQDPVYVYVAFLTAQQLVSSIKGGYCDFFEPRHGMLLDLQTLIEEGLQVKDGIHSSIGKSREQFFTWYESMFLQEVQP